jgi:DNA repair photolyase
VLRDLDILAPMAAKGLVKVALSITTLDADLARRLEPRASAPERRLHAIEELAKAGVPASVMVAPIIPAINDAEIETILTRAASRGAREAGYVMLRLPLELQDLFEEWLGVHFPDKLRHVMTLVRSMRKDKAYDAAWGERMTGTGPFAWMIGRRFEAAAARNGFASERLKLRTDLFRRPVAVGEQLSLL